MTSHISYALPTIFISYQFHLTLESSKETNFIKETQKNKILECKMWKIYIRRLHISLCFEKQKSVSLFDNANIWINLLYSAGQIKLFDKLTIRSSEILVWATPPLIKQKYLQISWLVSFCLSWTEVHLSLYKFWSSLNWEIPFSPPGKIIPFSPPRFLTIFST